MLLLLLMSGLPMPSSADPPLYGVKVRVLQFIDPGLGQGPTARRGGRSAKATPKTRPKAGPIGGGVRPVGQDHTPQRRVQSLRGSGRVQQQLVRPSPARRLLAGRSNFLQLVPHAEQPNENQRETRVQKERGRGTRGGGGG